MTLYITKHCVLCRKPGSISVDEEELFAYLRGEPAQVAFKTVSIPLREQIITGTHPECWEQIFSKEEEDVYE